MKPVFSKQFIGKIGEDYAVLWLAERGFMVLDRNWRFGRYEMDLIATKKGRLHFVEVKTRQGILFGWPEEHITGQKILRMGRLAGAYMKAHAFYGKMQLDILSIILSPTHCPSFLLLEDVYV